MIVSDGDLMEGISHEAASLAGHLRLEKLTVLCDDNRPSSDGAVALACSDDQLKRFAAYGWATKRVDGHDAAQVAAALSMAVRSKKPTLIACRTVVGFAAPRKADTASCQAAPLGAQEAQAAKQALGWNDPPFAVPEGVAGPWLAAGSRGAGPRRRLAEAAGAPCPARRVRAGDGRPAAGRFP